MGEHKRAKLTLQAEKWEHWKQAQWHRERSATVLWSKGTFQYHKQKPGIYGALKTRRQYKTVRKWLKRLHDPGQPRVRGAERYEVMSNIMGRDA